MNTLFEINLDVNNLNHHDKRNVVVAVYHIKNEIHCKAKHIGDGKVKIIETENRAIRVSVDVAGITEADTIATKYYNKTNT